MRDSNPSWQTILAQGFSSATELLDFLKLPTTLANQVSEQQFITRVPRRFANLMEKGNRNDPLLLQVLATDDELTFHDEFKTDPLQEKRKNPVKGLIHKYHGRVLITLTGACAINCRYCFRRYFPYHENNSGRQGWEVFLEYIRSHTTIEEVILSGGDPLLIKNNLLEKLIASLSSIPHIHTLRIHSRIPIVLPERIDEELNRILTLTSLNKVVVLHSNHPRELDERAQQACALLRQANCHLLNQSVLLRGVNNNSTTLTELSKRLFSCGVLPYYLHLLDKVQGSTHFEVSMSEAQTIFYELQTRLPGYLVPRLAKEIPGKPSKTLIPTL